jgi:methylated-DNA-[protein]-cysteine S-methyltransferase
MTTYTSIDSPIGPLLAARDGTALVAIRFHPAEPCSDWLRDDNAFDDVRHALDDYFEGSLVRFALPLDPRGTEFQKRVWRALLDVPFGETTTYGDLARGLGKPAAVRAIGAANGANPIPIIIPCHRVIGSDGSLVGFGGGLPVKRWLLDHEARTTGSRPFGSAVIP